MHLIILQADVNEGAEGFFNSSTWKFLTMITQVMIVALWLALVFWTYKDAKRRITDPVLIGVSVATSFFFPFVGTIFYTILRPPEYIEDVLERDLEIRAREQELVGGGQRCPACRMAVRDDYIVCPKCRRQLKSPCRKCSRPLDPVWRVCPYCEADVKAPVVQEDELFA